jgi:predicted Zn-dependent protease
MAHHLRSLDKFTIILIDEKSLNAFAAPGGVIGVNGGLFLNAGNEAQLASVLSHELAHLSQRHFARNILRGKDTNLASLTFVLSALIPAPLIPSQGLVVILSSLF